MATDPFKEAYERLNSAQKQAVDTIEGPVMVIAGPGTGKTQILTLRIANILRRTDTAPENILALTFTESGARAMRERLRTYVGSEAYRIPILTFHAFADRLVREYPENYGRIIGGSIIGDLERVTLMIDIIMGGTFRLIRPAGDPEYYVRPVLAAVQNMKREYVDTNAFAAIIETQEEELKTIPQFHEKGAHKGKVRSEYDKKEKAISKNKELLLAYKLYESALRERKLYDFEDVIIETVHALQSNEGFLHDLQETYQYILADEHQDVNGSQNRILELIASYHDRPNLFVVGDEKQAVYRFQGASLENFLYFEEKFPHTTTIALTDNYRSGQRILDAAHTLISRDAGPAAELRVPLIAQAVRESGLYAHAFTHQGVEDEWVRDDIEQSLKDGVPPDGIAVLFRTNKEVESFVSLLRMRGIPVRSSIETDVLRHRVMDNVRALMSAVADHASEQALFEVLHGSYWNIKAEDLFRVLSARSYERPLNHLIRDKDLLDELGIHSKEALLHVGEVIDSMREDEPLLPPHRLLERLLTESGYLAYLLAHDPAEGGLVVRRLYDEVERMVADRKVVTLRDVAEALKKRIAYNLPLEALPIGESKAAVSVMTAHKSKGLEFDRVYIPHLTDGTWSGKQRKSLFDVPLLRRLAPVAFSPYDDERRLLYVALTRAKTAAHVSYAEATADGKHADPSRLLGDIDDALIALVPSETYEATFVPTDILRDIKRLASVPPSLFKELLLERGLSATALNNYLESPWKYLYRNLLRFPEIKTLPAHLGTALHYVLERASRALRETGALPNEMMIKSLLEEKLNRLPLSPEEYASLHERGFAALTAYLKEKAPAFTPEAREEYKLRALFQTGDAELPELLLTGTIDRMDFDAEGRLLRVVDYKSGKPKSRNDIEGKTKDGKGNYKRQLTFYALLLSLEEDARLHARQGTLSFIEPDGKGVLHEENFEITDEEIAELKKEIVRVAKEIINGTCIKAPFSKDDELYKRLAKSFESN